MKVQHVFRNLEATEAIKAHTEKKLAHLNRIVKYPIKVEAIYRVERGLHIVELTCHAEKHNLFASAKTEDMYQSIDEAAKRLEEQIKKLRDKKRPDHNRKVYL